MNKIRFCQLLVGMLLLLNGVLWVGAYRHRPPHSPHDRPRQIVIERLQFNDQQIKQYDVLIQEHRQKIGTKDSTIRSLKNQLYVLTTINPPKQTIVDSLAHLIGEQQKSIEIIHYQHFADIRALCQPQQLAQFEQLTKDLSSIFAPHHPPQK